MEQLVKTEMCGHHVVITMNNPKALNQLSLKMMDELESAFTWARDYDDIHSIALFGEEVFSAGARIQELHEVASTRDPLAIKTFIARANRMANLIENVGKPTTAVIRKYCFGGGNELAMACEDRTLSGYAKFGQQEIKHGIMPGMGGTQRLPRLVGIKAAMPILLSGEIFSDEEAVKIGLVDTPGPACFYPHEDGCVTPYIVEDHLNRFLQSERYEEIIRSTEFPEASSAIIEAVREGMKRPLREGLEIEQAGG